MSLSSKLQYPVNLLISRLSYPLHLNFLSGLSFLFGSVTSRVKYDNYRLAHYAFGVYEAAARAKALGTSEITVIEFGVANGRGLMAMALYAGKVEKHFGIKIQVLGFDSGEGMPVTKGYKDHPELYATGDFPLQNREKLLSILPGNTKLIFLDLIHNNWTDHIKSPVAFMSVDLDYYSSTIAILNYSAQLKSELFLPNTLIYFDDILLPNHNPFQGELLAIEEFNAANPLRKIVNYAESLRINRRLKNARWINQIYQLHVLDHKQRNEEYRNPGEAPLILGNKYLK
ncbi:MAG: hypothetical protein IPP43_06670 [Chitinophagaceae bacterium]|nr:hypothetical protein [Chitinophagaceae bacterium]